MITYGAFVPASGTPIVLNNLINTNIKYVRVLNNSPYHMSVNIDGFITEMAEFWQKDIQIPAAAQGNITIIPSVVITSSSHSQANQLTIQGLTSTDGGGYLDSAIPQQAVNVTAAGKPIFTASFRIGVSASIAQQLNIYNPPNSGIICIFHSFTAFTSDTTLPICYLLTNYGADNNFPLAPTTFSGHDAGASGATSVAHVTAADSAAPLPATIQKEGHNLSANVDKEFMVFPDTYILYPGTNLFLSIGSSVSGKTINITAKWTEDIFTQQTGGLSNMPIATQVINDGVGAGYTVIEATAQGDIASDVLISNDGIAQFRGIILWTKNASYRATPKTFDSAGINGVLTTAHGLGLVPIVELEGAQHTITSPILLQDSSTEIHMRSATILHANNGMNDYIFKCNQSSGLLDNMAIIGSGKLDCNAANQTAGGGLDLKGASRFHLEDFWVEAPYESALHVHDSGGTFGYQNWLLNLRIMDGYLSPGVGRGIWLDNNDENIIRGCLIQGMGGTTDNDGWGIIDNNGLNLIDGCTFLGNGQGNNHAGGIKCYAAATGSRIIGCQFDGVKFTNVALFGGRNKVIGCSFLNIGYNNGVANSADGVYSKGLDNIIMGNDFVPEGSGTNGCYAQVELDGPSGEGYNIVVNNVFQAINTGGHNLLIDGTPSGNVTSPNILH